MVEDFISKSLSYKLIVNLFLRTSLAPQGRQILGADTSDINPNLGPVRVLPGRLSVI